MGLRTEKKLQDLSNDGNCGTIAEALNGTGPFADCERLGEDVIQVGLRVFTDFREPTSPASLASAVTLPSAIYLLSLWTCVSSTCLVISDRSDRHTQARISASGERKSTAV